MAVLSSPPCSPYLISIIRIWWRVLRTLQTIVHPRRDSRRKQFINCLTLNTGHTNTWQPIRRNRIYLHSINYNRTMKWHTRIWVYIRLSWHNCTLVQKYIEFSKQIFEQHFWTIVHQGRNGKCYWTHCVLFGQTYIAFVANHTIEVILCSEQIPTISKNSDPIEIRFTNIWFSVLFTCKHSNANLNCIYTSTN